ncbi:cationic amino acid transporter 2 [Trichonephila inaurata madagascariensis]|uniref:Cationic amino acid transporter 2 n=1 Tax=Trichonephila inaurata madagascariensis TaxID=2747483 RepID=A0A8X6X722_9ARAC|nr:cationic amino acid transporter 2 [Trichonephila inaurata madagascariensis]
MRSVNTFSLQLTISSLFAPPLLISLTYGVVYRCLVSAPLRCRCINYISVIPLTLRYHLLESTQIIPPTETQKMNPTKEFFKALVRRKPVDVSLEDTKLNRCLTTLDLTALGIGSTLGLGIYVLAGQVASVKAGPAVIVSFFIAAVASVFAGLCYAEFGARVPRAGSAYVYSYVTVGELMAFIIGWNLILEYVIGTASVARGYSGYIDSLFNGTMQKRLQEVMPMNIQHVSEYPDFLAFGITIFLALLLCFGVKESSRFNKVFTALNLGVVVFAIIAGSIKSDPKNWKLSQSEVPKDAGVGGFLPFGISGMMSGAATCFYGFIGFDCIATTGEEVKNPQKSIPISIVLSLLFVFLAYFGVSTVQTLMVPYYLQDNPAPLPYVFEFVGWPVCKWIISIGALAGLSTSLLGAIFPLPRVLYAMGSDGIIFRFLAKVHPRFQTPLIATAVSGVFAGAMAMMFNVHELADMMSIGTLLAYSLVAISVTILRYRCTDSKESSQKSKARYSSISQSPEKRANENENGKSILADALAFPIEKITYNTVIRQLLNIDGLEKPTVLTSKISFWLIGITSLLVLAMDAQLALNEEGLKNKDFISIICLVVVIALIMLCLLMLQRQPSENAKLSFKVPLVPYIPMLSVAINTYLMFKLSVLTWQRFGVWMAIGFAVYFFYGLWNSSERYKQFNSIKAVYTVDGGDAQLMDCKDMLNSSPLHKGKSSVESNMSELMSSVNSAEAKLISDHPSNGRV